MKNENRGNEIIDDIQRVYVLRHLTTREYICLRHDSQEYMACFSDGDSAYQFREELGLIEHVDVEGMCLGDAPFNYFWLNGTMTQRSSTLANASTG